MIAIDLCKQELIYADPKVNPQVNFTGNLDLDGLDQQCFSLLKKRTEVFHIFTRKCKSIVNLSFLI